MEWMLLPLKRYADFSGRSRRKEYWMYVLGLWIAIIVSSIIDGVLGLTGMIGGVYGPLTAIVYLGTLVPTIAVAVRRAHDSDKSGWFILIPIYNLILMFLDGTKGPNRFGPDPKDPAGAQVFA
jgi:uncharacterized membrane protein YhaH (DUF805 family)